MKSFQTIVQESLLVESKAYKAIFTQAGKKIQGARSGKLLLGFVDDEGYVKNVTWKEFKASSLPWSPTQQKEDSNRKKDFIQALLRREKQFNKQVDYNSWHQKNKTASFETKVDKVLEMTSANYPKSGLKD